MVSALTSPTAPRLRSMRPALAVASIGSMVAGLVHLAAARNHEGDAVLLWMFVLCAIAQLGWGIAITAREHDRRLLLVGIVINGGALLVWALTRTVGVPVVSALSAVEPVARQDLGAASFAAISLGATLRLALRPAPGRVLSLPMVGALATVALLAAVPAISAAHVHEHRDTGEHHSHDEAAAGHDDDHAHGDDETSGDHAHAETAGHEHDGGTGEHAHEDGADGLDHGDGHGSEHDHAGPEVAGSHAHPDDPGAPHAHPDGDSGTPHQHPDDPTDPDGGHEHPDDPTDPDDGHEHPDDPTEPDDPIVSLDDPRLTPEQFAAAIDLIVSTTQGMSGFLTEQDLTAAGYTSIGDGGTPGTYTHWVNWSYLGDPYELDPAHIESVVMKMNADGTSRVVSAMYILTLGKTMEDVPDIAGELTTWHDHDDLCFDGTQLVGIAVDGVCTNGFLVATPPMLHVWIEDNGCGPFVGIDQHGITCDATHEGH